VGYAGKVKDARGAILPAGDRASVAALAAFPFDLVLSWETGKPGGNVGPAAVKADEVDCKLAFSLFEGRVGAMRYDREKLRGLLGVLVGKLYSEGADNVAASPKSVTFV